MNIRWAQAARQDRAQIFEYIESRDPSAAVRIDQLFVSAIARLKDLPLLGRPGAIAGTRELIPHESYRVVYEIEGDTIWILMIVHTARSWPPEAE
jgi:toxin ParE1/3/4